MPSPAYDRRENVAFGLEMRKLGAEIAARSAEALRLVRLEGFSERMPRQLSGGQQRARPRPCHSARRSPARRALSNLDAKLREEVRIEIRELQRQLGLTTVMVTHDQEEALTVADRLVVMADGGIARLAASAIFTSGRRTASSPASWGAAPSSTGVSRRPAISRRRAGFASRPPRTGLSALPSLALRPR